jgi:hypothetical protein
LLALVAQFCGIVLLWYRRVRRPVRLWAIDTRNLQMVLGVLTAVTSSLVISLISTEWTIEDQPSDDEMLLSNLLVDGTPSATQDMITSSEVAPADRAFERNTDRDNASLELGGHARNITICTGALLLFDRLRSPLLRCAQPLRTLNQIPSRIPEYV